MPRMRTRPVVFALAALATVRILTHVPVHAQQAPAPPARPAQQGDPHATEVWEPVPKASVAATVKV